MLSSLVIYTNLWLWTMLIFSFYQYVKYSGSGGCTILRSENKNSVSAIAYTIVFAVITGLRPSTFAHGWADTSNYALLYYMSAAQVNTAKLAQYTATINTDTAMSVDVGKEWLWDALQKSFAGAGIDVSMWFLFWSVLYVGFIYLAVRKFFPNNQWLGLLFFIGAWFFTSYAYNGIRNGVACSMILYAFTFLIKKDTRNLLIGLIIGVLAMGIHKSAALPLMCILVATRFNIGFNTALGWWCFAIVISLALGSTVQVWLAHLGFDDRMTSYAGKTADQSQDASMFSSTGFRFDFVLYSLMPILLGYYIIIKRGIQNRAYTSLIVTYILANAFWIMVIRAEYSNRFAHLSWFMYPLVMAYPLLRMKIWSDQDRKTVTILLAYVAFTAFMTLVYWG